MPTYFFGVLDKNGDLVFCHCVLLACDWKDKMHARKLPFITGFFFHVRLSTSKNKTCYIYHKVHNCTMHTCMRELWLWKTWWSKCWYATSMSYFGHLVYTAISGFCLREIPLLPTSYIHHGVPVYRKSDVLLPSFLWLQILKNLVSLTIYWWQ